MDLEEAQLCGSEMNELPVCGNGRERGWVHEALWQGSAALALDGDFIALVRRGSGQVLSHRTVKLRNSGWCSRS